MKQEAKELLLRDLCSRLPYGVILNCCDSIGERLIAIDEKGLINYDYDIDEVKPYLFPLSSMTAEQLYELREMFGFEIEFGNGFIDFNGRLSYLEMDALFEWLDRHHFDYRELIPNGLALDASNLNIY